MTKKDGTCQVYLQGPDKVNKLAECERLKNCEGSCYDPFVVLNLLSNTKYKFEIKANSFFDNSVNEVSTTTRNNIIIINSIIHYFYYYILYI